jgi:hypothetical protein
MPEEKELQRGRGTGVVLFPIRGQMVSGREDPPSQKKSWAMTKPLRGKESAHRALFVLFYV